MIPLPARFYHFGFLAFTLATSLHAQTNAAPNLTHAPTPPRIAVLHEVVTGQGGGRDLHADIAYPQDVPGPLPAVLYIHGGGWAAGDYRRAPIQPLAKAGYFAASIEYRLSQEAKWPAQIEDCKLGVRWLRANAAKYNVDPNRIGVWGESAGGHLVACLGTMDAKEYEGTGGYPGVSSAVQAVVDYYGPTDFTRPDIYSPYAIGVTEALLGCKYDENPALWKSASPCFYVKAGDPPTFIAQGTSDTTVPPGQSTAFDEALTKAGVPHELMLIQNAGHGFAPVGGKKLDPPGSEIRRRTLAFLDKYLKGTTP